MVKIFGVPLGIVGTRRTFPPRYGWHGRFLGECPRAQSRREGRETVGGWQPKGVGADDPLDSISVLAFKAEKIQKRSKREKDGKSFCLEHKELWVYDDFICSC